MSRTSPSRKPAATPVDTRSPQVGGAARNRARSQRSASSHAPGRSRSPTTASTPARARALARSRERVSTTGWSPASRAAVTVAVPM